DVQTRTGQPIVAWLLESKGALLDELAVPGELDLPSLDHVGPFPLADDGRSAYRIAPAILGSILLVAVTAGPGANPAVLGGLLLPPGLRERRLRRGVDGQLVFRDRHREGHG